MLSVSRRGQQSRQAMVMGRLTRAKGARASSNHQLEIVPGKPVRWKYPATASSPDKNRKPYTTGAQRRRAMPKSTSVRDET